MQKFQPALYGGLLIGVLSALPVVNFGNCCCCLWIVSGGVVAAYLQQQRLGDTPLQTSDAAIQGVVAGLVGAVVGFVIGLLLMPIEGAYQQRVMAWVLERLRQMPNIPPESMAQLEQAATNPPERTIAAKLFWFVCSVPVDAIFAMLGALLGVAFFKKKGPAAPVATTL